MQFKMIIVFVNDDKSNAVIKAAREAGATGATTISHARGEGAKPNKTFLGLTLETQRDVLLLLVEKHLSRHIMEEISRVGEFDDTPGTGIALQIDVEDAIGVSHQIQVLSDKVEKQL